VILEESERFRALAALKQAKDDAEVAFRQCAADCIGLVEPRRVELSRTMGKCLASLDVNGLTYVHQNRYSAIKDESDAGGPTLDAQRESLLALFGADFSQYFVEQMTVSIDVSKLSEAQLEALAALDPEVTCTLKPTASLHADRTLKPDVASKCEQAHIGPVQYFKA
jgi:hypothetical protein